MNDKKMSTTALTVMGVLLVIFGVVAIATPAVAGATVVMVIGAVLALVGIVQIITGLRTDGMVNKITPVVLGVLALLCGGTLLGEPWIGMKYITLFLAIFFGIEGFSKIVASFSYRPASGWFMLLISGVIAMFLGFLIWKQWPISGMWAVGILVGVNLLSTGISMIFLASTIRQLGNIAEQVKES